MYQKKKTKEAKYARAVVLFALLLRYSLYLRLTLLLHTPLATGTTVRGIENASLQNSSLQNASLLSPEGRSRRSISSHKSPAIALLLRT